MEETKEIELFITEGEAGKQIVNEGEIMEDAQVQEIQKKDTELLQSINQKLDLLLAAQNIS